MMVYQRRKKNSNGSERKENNTGHDEIENLD